MELLGKINLHLKKNVLIYALLMGLAVVISFCRNMLFGYILDPAEMGYYTIVITISSYGTFLQIGLMSGLTRELPISLRSEERV